MLKFSAQIVIVFILIGSCLTQDCGDWVAFKDEKCFKVFDVSSTETEAEGVCREQSNGSVLAIIITNEEQQIIENYLKKENIANNVWIGIKKSNNSFKYLDGTDINYNNWAKDRPLKNSIDSNCVEISVDETNFGKWTDDKCQRKNAVLCQKIQPWSVERLQSILLETRRLYQEEINQLIKVVNTQRNELDKVTNITIPAQQKVYNGKIDKLTDELTSLKKKTIPELSKVIDNLRSNPVPIGFIYVQLSGQSEPKTLWPNTEWSHISGKYAGLFFRAEGGQSSPFDKIQEQLSQSLVIQSDKTGQIWQKDYFHGPLTVSEKFELPLYSGSNSYPVEHLDFYALQLKHNNEEIRPRNQAIRIWQRVK